MSALLSKNGQAPKVFERSPAVEGNILGGVLFSDLHFDRTDVENTPIQRRMEHATECYKRAIDRVLMFNPDNLLVGSIGDTQNTD
jgi:hypothetical protein